MAERARPAQPYSLFSLGWSWENIDEEGNSPGMVSLNLDAAKKI